MNNNPYHFNDHKHNYAVWTAARAVQRSFTTTEKIKEAIKESGLKAFAESDASITADEFDNFHKETARKIISSLQVQNVESPTYGRAAKIIGIYLKTTVILTGLAKCNRSEVIHPPIDSILLKKLTAKEGINGLDTPWTTLDENGYWNLVSIIRDSGIPFNWQLEKYWEV